MGHVQYKACGELGEHWRESLLAFLPYDKIDLIRYGHAMIQ
jgi:hypothetical protein